MKANEAPEKIQLGLRINDCNDWEIRGYSFLEDKQKGMTEYIRKDALIKKACEWLQNHNNYLRVHDNGRGVRFDMTQCVIDFRKALKGE